ncbi:MAG: histidine kinase dimerization/phospho-acceptor domain-containing protein, partial [Marinilabiliaceae bacterium]
MIPFQKTGKFKAGYWLILVFFLFQSSSTLLSAGERNACKNILLLNSYHSTFQWTHDITRGVKDEFSDPRKYRVFVEHMDAKRFRDPELTERLIGLYQTKYSSTKIDGIVVSDNRAFDFVLKYGPDIWEEQIPISFCGINNIRDYDFDTTRIKGVEEYINIDSTLRMIKTLQPDLNSLIVISDTTISGSIFTKQFLHTAENNHPDLKYQLIETNDPQSLKDTLSNLSPENNAIYLLSMYIQRDGIKREMNVEKDIIRNNCPAPVYGNWDFLLDDFIMGGVILQGYDQGREAAKAIKSMLESDPHQPWLVSVRETLALDYQQLQKNKNKISRNDLINQATIFNRPDTPWQMFRNEILAVSIIGVLLLLVIVILLKVIHVLRKTKKDLLKSESRLEMALESADEGLWDVDFNSGEVFLSRQFAQLLNYNHPAEMNVNTRTQFDNLHPEDRHQASEAFRLHMAGETPLFKCEARLMTKIQAYKWFSIHGKIIEKSFNGNPLRMTGTIKDIQTQKEFENKLKEAKEKAEESARLKSAFLANMSHEIRTPMNAILGFTDLLMYTANDNEKHDFYLSLIKSSGENLLNLINDIIDISKIESGQLTIHNEQFDLHKVLNQTVTIASSIIQQNKKNIRLKVHFGSTDKEFFIRSDPWRLQQILLNLLTNAIKFTADGFIEAGYLEKNNKLEFYVKDTGIGIYPHHQQIIFERFRQVHETS